MKKMVRLFSSFLIVTSLAACGFLLPATVEPSNQEVVDQYQTVSVLLTQTSQWEQTATMAPPTRTQEFTPAVPAPTRTYTPMATMTVLTATAGDSPAPTCDLARAGLPIDVTIPDDTHLAPGTYFSKTWRLVNAGTCTWDRGYAVIWFSGDDLGVTRVQNINGVVAPGQSIDVTVDMQAPETPGVYQSNWKLRNNQGAFFGIGPGGTAPFWVRIAVVSVNTETPEATQPPPTATPTPIVYISGTVDLPVDSGFDFDTGEMDQLENDDMRFFIAEDGLAQLLPENGARLVSFGRSAPGLADCASISLSTSPVYLNQVHPGAYLCYRTTEGLPGYLVIQVIDDQQSLLSLEFLTWAVP